jgi:hypothetical protein
MGGDTQEPSKCRLVTWTPVTWLAHFLQFLSGAEQTGLSTRASWTGQLPFTVLTDQLSLSKGGKWGGNPAIHSQVLPVLEYGGLHYCAPPGMWKAQNILSFWLLGFFCCCCLFVLWQYWVFNSGLQAFFVLGFFQMESCKLYLQAGFEPWSSWSLPPE